MNFLSLLVIFCIIMILAYAFSSEEKKAKVRAKIKRGWNNFCDFLDEIFN